MRQAARTFEELRDFIELLEAAEIYEDEDAFNVMRELCEGPRVLDALDLRSVGRILGALKGSKCPKLHLACAALMIQAEVKAGE